MRTIRDWLTHLLWRAERRPRALGAGLHVRLAVGSGDIAADTTADMTNHARDGDLRLVADDPETAEAILRRLAELGTVDRVDVSLDPAATPPMRRRLDRQMRWLRRPGLDVRWHDDG